MEAPANQWRIHCLYKGTQKNFSKANFLPTFFDYVINKNKNTHRSWLWSVFW